MQNKVLADLVIQKMKEKKEEELRNMPHYKILQLQTTFDYQRNLILKQEVTELQGTLSHLQNTLLTLQERSEQLQFTGKRNFPRIIIKPDFIASEKIDFKLKEFYRKLSNTFLRLGILRRKKTAKSQEISSDLTPLVNEISRVQKEWRKKKEEQRVQTNNKRKKVEKQKLRLENLNQQIQSLKKTIKKQREDNIVLVKEYELKKGGMENRKQRLAFVENQIQQYKRKIEQEFTPLVYREHLAKISVLQTKNQFFLERLRAVNNQISSRTNNQHSTSLFKSKKKVHSARNKDQKLIVESLIGSSNNKKSVYLGNMSTLDLTNDRASLNMSSFNKIDSQQEIEKVKMRFRSQASQICEKRQSLYSKLSNYVINQNRRKGI